MICTPYQLLLYDQIKKKEMGRVRSKTGREEMNKGFWWGDLR
jgi:hypothetical protein